MGQGPPPKKRKLASAASNTKPPKRRTAHSAKAQGPMNTKRQVDVNALAWRNVEVPEMFDDAEGFFGLEEVDGVDVVRDGDTVRFVTAAPTEDDDEEFEGFSDSPKPAQEIIKPVKTATSTPIVQKRKPPTTNADSRKKPNSLVEDLAETDSGLADGGFKVLEEVSQDEDETDVSAWMELDLSQHLLSCLAHMKFSKPTAIQSAAIPEILAGHDVIGKASTGSGKTLAFAIPIVEKWLSRNAEKAGVHITPTALIMSPTRELAHQISTHIKDLCASLPAPPYVCSVTGGLSVQKQQRQLEKADIIVGTPGRLWEVLSSNKKLLETFKAIDFLIMDEADRLLTEGHFKEAEDILQALDREQLSEGDQDGDRSLRPRQTLVFSATFNKGLQQKLAGKHRYDVLNEGQSMEYLLKRLNFREEMPKFMDVNPVSQMAEGLREGLVECGAMEKDLYLYAVLMLHPTQRALVFANSISSVRRVTPMLQNLNLPVLPLHSQMPQKARLRSVERFTSSKPNSASVLIATDVAARGLDIPGIDVIIHYHVPRTADAYVHRSGRTARAENRGTSILLCGPEEATPTRRLLAKVHLNAVKRADASGGFIRSIDIDRRVVARLKDRVNLAKKIADAALAKEKGSKDDNWMRSAAEDLGVEYDSDELEKAGRWTGRGSERKMREKNARGLSKAEVGSLRAELKHMLSMRVNTGVSEKYITNGNVDINDLLQGGTGDFLGRVNGLEMDDV